jgi:hypothetical protein
MATINTTDPKPGYVYNQDDDTWYPLLGLATQALDELTDVVITSPTTSQILVYNGTNWVNGGETGDISAVTSGTGITVTNGTGPIPTIAIDTTTTVDLSTAQTLTNKTLTAPVVTYSVNAVTSAAYTSVASDAAAIVTMNNASANTFSIPTNASVPYAVGSTITLIQIGAGQTTINAVSSGTTTIASTGATPTAPVLRAQYSSATCIKVATDTWYVVGDIT